MSKPYLLTNSWRMLSVGVLLWACPAQAQTTLGQAALDAPGDGLHTSVATRLRFETIDNTPRTGYSPSETWWNLRTNLTGSYVHGPIRVAVEITDSRVWGAQVGSVLTSNDVNTFEPTQVYVTADLGKAFGPKSSLKLTGGRMSLNLGSRRLVAADDYRNTANTYTGLRADAGFAGGYKSTLIYVLPIARLPDDPVNLSDNAPALDKESMSTILWGGLVSHSGKGAKTGPSPLLSEVSFYHFRERDWPGHATRDRNLNTAGARLYVAPRAGQIDGEVEAMYQWGRESASTAPTAATLDVSATFFHAHVGYSMKGAWKPRIALEFDRVSGDGPGATYGRFDTLYGMRRADFAPSGMYSATGRANIASPALRVEATPSKRADVMATWRPMWLADWHDSFSNTSVRDVTGKAGDFAGHQFDARVRYWIIPQHLRGEIDGVYVAKGRFLTEAPNAPKNGDTRYASVNLTAVF